ncbi:MAG: T9SS type A sorting domain-containing protein, partial [Brumimicrobium sp.]
MKKKLLLLCTTISFLSFGQTELYSDDLETTGTFIMPTGNTNDWVINDNYLGGTIFSGAITIPDVPAQPATISNQNGNYLHLLSTFASSEGVNNANYVLGFSTDTHMAAMTTLVNTTGYENVTLKFWRTGGANGIKVLYRVDGGAWTDSGHTFSGSPTNWTEYTVPIPAGDDVSEFSIAFEFDETVATDPAPNHYHSIDEISIEGDIITGGATSLTSSVQGGTTFCGDETILVDYNGTGTYNAGNDFNLELSDELGDFTSATQIGTLASTSNTGTITGTIPAGITSGTAYRVRVVSTDDPFVGDDNGTDLTLNPTPTATADALDTEVCEADNIELIANTVPGATYIWSGPDGFSSSDQNPIINGVSSDSDGNYDLVIEQNGCGSSVSTVVITVNPIPAAPIITQNGNDLESNYASGNQWFMDGSAISGATDQIYTVTANGEYTVVHTSAEGCESLPSATFVVDDLSVSNQQAEDAVSIYPNPFTNKLSIVNLKDFQSLKVIDVTGKIVKEMNISEPSIQLNAEKWEKGIYFLQMNKNGKSHTFKLI